MWHTQVVGQLLSGVPSVDSAGFGSDGTPLDGLSQSFYSMTAPIGQPSTKV